jgi:hypothetical protein
MKLYELAEITLKPPTLYVENEKGKLLIKTVNKHLKNAGEVLNAEVIKISSNGVVYSITVKEIEK